MGTNTFSKQTADRMKSELGFDGSKLPKGVDFFCQNPECNGVNTIHVTERGYCCSKCGGTHYIADTHAMED